MAGTPRPPDGRTPPGDPGTSISTTLLDQLQAGSETGWQRFDYLFRPLVVGWCRGAGLPAEAADDLTQEVLQAVSQHIASFRRQRLGDSFRGWLWRITQNKIRDHFRKAKQREHSPGGTSFQERLRAIPDSASPEESSSPADADQAGLYQRAFALLKEQFAPQTMRAFLKVVVEGQPVEAVAAELGMSKGAIYTAKSRVLTRLRAEFGDLLS